MYDINNTAIEANTTVTAELANDAGFVFEPKRWPLTIDQMRCLFEKLSEDDAYRALFVSDIHAAFAQLPGAPTVPAAMTPGTCFRPTNLASKDALRIARDHVVSIVLARNVFIPKMLEA